ASIQSLSAHTAAIVTIMLAPGPRYTIGAVALTMSKELLEKELVGILQDTLVGRYCTQELLSQGARRIKDYCDIHGYIQQKLSYYQTRNPAKKTVTVCFSVEVVPKKRYSFTGNSFYTETELSDACTQAGFQEIDLPVHFFSDELLLLYKKKGFLETTVHSEEILDRTIFDIQEGPRTVIKKVVVVGDEGPGKAFIERECTVLYEDYDEDALRSILGRWRAELQTQGYWDGTVVKKALVVPRKGEAELVLEVALGERRMAQHVNVVAYPFLVEEEQFSAYKNLTEPRPLSLEVVREQKRSIQDALRRRGYLYTPVSFSLEEQEGRSVIEWTVDLSPGPVRFGKTTIVGLSRMKPSIVERELCYKENDPWDHRSIDYSLQQLKNLGMFSSVSLAPECIDPQVQNLVVKCCEDDPFEIRTRLGFQVVSKSFTRISWSTYKLGGSFLWKNPAGNADRFALDLDFTRYTRIVAASYEVPWIGPYPIRTFFKLYSDRFDQPFAARTQQKLYREAHDGASVTLLSDRVWGLQRIAIGFEFTKVYGISQKLAETIQFEPRLVGITVPYLYVEPSVAFESLDNKIDPSFGWSLVASLKAMVPIGVSNGWFIRALIEQSFYYPLFRSAVGAFRWQCGHVFNAQFSTILPTERFYLGGSHSVRGYEPNMVPPLNDVVCDGCTLWAPVGGKTVAAINAEIRFGIYDRLSGAVFTDGGILTQNRFADIAANRWFGASGFGIRCATPVGPIRFDIGWKWRKRDPQDTSYAFFLTMGQAF
ncbi:BamA/TamA family outer membrane protein, partial [Candidatus Dependentiae bacterium]|nr:BamA/TamA family outer membrane protein [Candidatus Dependentiae bacterium]